MRGSNRKYALEAGSPLLRSTYWASAAPNELKGLIKRFATREEQCRSKGISTYPWRRRRLSAVAVYESRFEQVPDIFRKRELPRMRSYYVHNAKYVWPERGEPGRPVEWKGRR
jgi:hypothetical protein